MKSSALRLVIALIPLLLVSARAQNNVDEAQGLRPYDSFHGGDLDSVSLTTGGLALHIPLLSYPQRGNLDLSFSIVYSSKQWTVVTKCADDGSGNQTCTSKWEPLPRGGRLPIRVLPSENLGLTGAFIASSTDWYLQSFVDNSSAPQWSRSFMSPDGNVHSVGASFDVGFVYPMRSLDGTGLLHQDANTLILPNGVRYSYVNSTLTQPGFWPTSVTDPNGNQITITPSAWTDTMGRVIPASNNQPGVSTADLSACPAGTVSARVWDVPGYTPVSPTRRFTFCYANFSIFTSFGMQGVEEYPSTSTALLSAVVLPDNTEWTLAYDNYGDVTRLGFPTGGSISYTYACGPVQCSSGTARSLWVKSRAVDANDGTGPQTWQYNYAGQVSGSPEVYSGTATVSAPDGNDTVHTITSPVPGAYSSLYDTQVKYYQGSSGTGTVLKTVSTQYTGIVDPFTGSFDTADNVVPLQITTTWPDGRSSRVVNTWDTGNSFSEYDGNAQNMVIPVVFSSLLQKDEYDFSNSLVRSTFNHYKWQDDANYKNNNFLNLPVSSTVKNAAGCELAKTSNGYDETYLGVTVQSSGVSEQHVAPPGPVRGNHTSTSHWLIASCAEQSAVTSHTIPYDTGLPYQSYDPLNHKTQYTYSSTFYGAYLTETDLPDTQMPDAGAPVVHHTISGDYDFNTGLLTRFTDENSQNFTYTYDNMLRLTQGNHPDLGQTKFSYPDPNTVIRQRLISSGVWEDAFTAKFDGLGRTYQTQQITPSGTIQVDTTYDVVGRVSTVSNPYYQGTAHSSDPTYGLTTTTYDGLSRVTQTQKQDGSISQVQYSQVAGDGDTSVECTIATDEAGKKRQICSDGLGRMVKVLEPNPGSVATPASGWITISGSEQSAQSQPATAASVTLAIGGSNANNVDTICRPTGCNSVNEPDSGTVSFTVVAGGVTVGPVSTPYGPSHPTTPAAIAAALYSNFPANSVVTMSNPNGGTSFTLTTIATGTSANGSTISTSMATDCIDSDTMTCTGPGWSMTLSGPNLAPTTVSPENFSGAQNAATTPDSGQITATVNGTNYQVSFGSGDNTGTIATRLASAISAGTWASASASGGTVTLSSKTFGTAGDYSLSASYTWNSTQFPSPSFTTSSSSSVSGGLDAGALNNQPYVTVYQYDALNNMTRVDQKGNADSSQWRTRTFSYDSLSRLITAQNPENGTMCYGTWSGTSCINGYDADGNLLKKTDGRNITVTYAYDALNRLTDKTYSDSTPAASYRYDYSSFLGQTFAFPIGREVATMVAGSTPEVFTSYDAMGRVKQTTQCNPGVSGCKTSTAGYDLLGDVTSMAYPSGTFTVTYSYDSAARLTGAIDSAGVTYAQTVPANILAGGELEEFTSPNFANNKFHTDFNKRLQPVEIWAGVAQGSSALFDKQYSYGTAGGNNGNIFTITNVKDSTRTQTFTYDLLNRLSTAQEGSRWSNNYTYDPWGNLTKKLYGSVQAGEHMDTSADTGNHLLGYSYDTGGNMTTDGVNTYAYDGENRITSVAGVTYTYDADGHRVKKSSGTNYWYGPSGEPLAETDSAGTWTNYVFFAGQRLARNVNGDIKYYITDHLHSTGMFVDKAGTAAAVLDDNDFYPWGGIVAGVGKTSSNNTVKFTGKYRDTESGLDYFGARYYANAMGRFMSPDWAAKPVTVPYAKFGDPQSLNLYGYVENVPLNRVDADGHSYAGFDGFLRPTGANVPMADVEISVADGGFQLGENGTRGPDEEPTQAQHLPNNGEGSEANLDRRAKIATVAQAHEGDTSMPYTPGHPTCNLFVQKDIAEAGAPKPEVTKADGTKGAPSAAEWAQSNIPHWRFLKHGEAPQPGDVAARKEHFVDATGHSGIVVAVSKNGVVTVVAAHATVIGKDMSFQPGSQEYHNVFRRYTGD